MSQFKNVINYLKDPQLVADFQRKLGIISLHHKNNHKEQNRKFLNTDIDCESSRKGSREKNKNENVDKLANVTNINSNLEEEIEYKIQEHEQTKHFKVKYKLLYYFFFIGTYLGDEIFYSIYFPFWFWNIDYNVGRRIITVWAVVMYLGQSIKDVIKWPRPICPPAVRVQAKWSLEYGMPSTHAMIAVGIPMSSILFTMDKYSYPLPLAITVAVVMCIWVCTSRIYLGMHTVLDVLVGVILSLSLVIITVPLLIYLDSYLVTWRWTALIILVLTMSLVIFYPNCDKWTPTRGDTTTVLGCIAGIYMGACIIHQVTQTEEVPPVIKVNYLEELPIVQTLGIYFVRFLIGIVVIVLLEVILATATHTVDRILGLDPKETRIQRKQRLPALDLTYKYITYWILGFTVAILPLYLTIGFNLNSLI